MKIITHKIPKTKFTYGEIVLSSSEKQQKSDLYEHCVKYFKERLKLEKKKDKAIQKGSDEELIQSDNAIEDLTHSFGFDIFTYLNGISLSEKLMSKKSKVNKKTSVRKSSKKKNK